MLKQRIISALIAIPIFAWVMLGAPWWVFAAAWWLIINTAAYEWSKLMPSSHAGRSAFIGIIAVLTAVVLLGVRLFFPKSEIEFLFLGFLYGYPWSILYLLVLLLAAIAWIIAVPMMLRHFAKTGAIIGGTVAMFALGILFFIAFALSITTFAYYSFYGSGFQILVFLVFIWANDAGAYFCGKAFGKHKFSPNISPNKTWEGFIGGLAIAMLLCTLFFGFKIYWLLASLLALVFATIGDLFQSMLKRHAGVKDSGNIMPGHGGAYDRIDSWLPSLLIWNIAMILSFVWLFRSLGELF